MKRYTLAELEGLPTLSVSQADDLKIETTDTRIWLSRCSVEDGEPFDNAVTVERLMFDGDWATQERYPAI